MIKSKKAQKLIKTNIIKLKDLQPGDYVEGVHKGYYVRAEWQWNLLVLKIEADGDLDGEKITYFASRQQGEEEQIVGTTFLPSMLIPVDSINRMQALAVAGAIIVFSETKLPRLSGVNPSTSLCGSIELMISSSSICFGNGSCTRIP